MQGHRLRRGRLAVLWVALAALLAGGCQIPPPEPREPSSGHVSTETPRPAANIPEPVSATPYVPLPKPAPASETYTVVVSEVPVKELLFALARDASLNVDIHPRIEGVVTLNAVNQTLDQILDRVSRQVDLRYTIEGDTLTIVPDTPFLRTYRVDYVNISRDAQSTAGVSTIVGTSGDTATSAGGTGSTTTVTTVSNHHFWETLTDTLRSMLSGEPLSDQEAQSGGRGFAPEEAVIANPESGIIIVRATARQHEAVQRYLDEVLTSSRRQVLIEATIVEVELADNYQAGVDWNKLAFDAGFAVVQSVTAGALGVPPFFALQYANSRDAQGNPNGDISLTVRLLKEFGDTRVLSSPKLMVLNNQTAVLKVVENTVYFEVTVDTTQGDSTFLTTFETTAKTVPVGVVMSVTPQIDGSDEVTLNVRPTITRIVGFVNDPNPALADAQVTNPVPEIQIREMESMLRIGTGQLAVLGGLMQDSAEKNTDGVPVLSDIEGVGEAFKYRENQFSKTELVIFLRPWVIRTPSVTADLRSFQPFLPENLRRAEPIPPPAVLQ